MAKAKQFQYDTLLRVRQRQEEAKAQRLAAVQREIHANTVQRKQIEDEQIHILGAVSDLTRRAFDPRVAKAYYQYERHLARLSVERDAEIARLQGIAEARRLELVEAYQKRRMIERLKERRDLVYAKEINRQEQKLLDEVASNRAAMSDKARA